MDRTPVGREMHPSGRTPAIRSCKTAEGVLSVYSDLNGGSADVTWGQTRSLMTGFASSGIKFDI